MIPHAEEREALAAASIPRLPSLIRPLAHLSSLLGTSALLTAAEVLAIVVWAAYVSRNYLGLSPDMLPGGIEYFWSLQSNHLWRRALDCGVCALWNGSIRGGAPAFADIYGSPLHPLVALTALIFGVRDGAALALAGAFLMHGLAQWWLGRVLGLSRLARTWCACIAVAAGSITSRIDIGTFGLVISTAACALVLPPLIALSRSGSRRDAALLGMALGLALLGGQGYLQLGMVLIAPAALLLLGWPLDRSRVASLASRMGLALLIAVLIGSPLLVPFAHFLPSFGKHLDAEFGSVMPFRFLPLTLVIDDPAFYRDASLGKLPFPYLYANFIGWVPVVLAGIGLARGRRDLPLRLVVFLAATTLLALWVAGGAPLLALSNLLKGTAVGEIVIGMRYPSLVAGLAIPPLLGLAGLGLDALLRWDWPSLGVRLSTLGAEIGAWALNLRWGLALPLLVALGQVQAFAAHYTDVSPIEPATLLMVDALQTPDLQWVDTPFGEGVWMDDAIAAGLKLASAPRPWDWRDRPPPAPALIAARSEGPPGTTPVAMVADIGIYASSARDEYAAVTHDDGGRTVCSAQGVGGIIDVTCSGAQAGALEVREYSFSGWSAWVDGKPTALLRSPWLAVRVPEGATRVELRYLPWDVPLGVGLSLVGLGLAAWQWRRPETPGAPASARPARGVASDA